jgi:hypothetical protein
MSAGIGDALYILYAVGTAALAAFHLWVWARRGFRIPRYIHVMALAAALVGWGLLEISPADSPARRGGLLEAVLLILIFPALVYGYFVLHGGATGRREE